MEGLWSEGGDDVTLLDLRLELCLLFLTYK